MPVTVLGAYQWKTLRGFPRYEASRPPLPLGEGWGKGSQTPIVQPVGLRCAQRQAVGRVDNGVALSTVGARVS